MTALSVDKLQDKLKELHQLTSRVPLFNPVFQLSHEISHELENGEVALPAIGDLVSDLEAKAIELRRQRLHSRLAPVANSDNLATFRSLVESTVREGLETFTALWAKPLMHIVFTAHPTFLLNPAQCDAVAGIAPQETPTSPESITLDEEHAQALAALTRAGAARDKLSGIILDVAAAHWPDAWKEVQPAPYQLATWVGYDMDGRTDISWATSVKYRLQEKAARLRLYADQLRTLNVAPDVVAKLVAAEVQSRAMVELFDADLAAPEKLSTAANALTQDDPTNIRSLAPIIATLEELANAKPLAEAKLIRALTAAMRTDGLGMGSIHFRVNSTQLLNAVRSRIDPDNTLDLASRTALLRLRKLLKEVQPLRSNFAALAIENTTALRQFLVMAQILHHIDHDAPIRMLIAECEAPQTVLAALYFARLFGIADKVDVSPLFETETALEHGARFLDALLAERDYQAYAHTRGRVAIQTGFSDAGRFVGQIPAALAIERLHGSLAHLIVKHKLSGVTALIFNTHGESMGRGAHPVNMTDRMTYPMSLWARAQFADRHIPTALEVSFQGGDGYLYFRSDELALATLTRIAEVERAPRPDEDDPFYTRTDLSLDFYRGIRRVQRMHLDSRTYARAVTAFGLGLLNETGSRKSRRQSDIAADRTMSLRQIRAIPHNAILQQLGYPVNVLAGIGTAATDDLEAIANLLNASARGRQLMRLVRASDQLASIKSVAAYGELFNSAYWATRPYRGTEEYLEPACLALAEKLTNDDRTGVFRRLSSRLRVDGLKLHRLLPLLSDPMPEHDGQETRRALGVLHALRLALIQHMFLRVVQIPAFSRSNDISRDDVLEMVFTLRIDDALKQLRRAFPITAPSLDDFKVDEPTDYPDSAGQAYADIQSSYIQPIADAYALCLRISTVIACHFDAHG